MTSPVRKRKDRSRRRGNAPETIEAARQCFACTDAGGRGHDLEPLSTADCLLVRKAAREGWETSPEKQREYIDRLAATLFCDNTSAILAAARTLMTLHELSQ